MGLLHESTTYPAFNTGESTWQLVGEVWEAPSELRDFETKFGKGDFYVIPILPKGAERTSDNVVALWVKKGARLAALSKAVRAAGADDVEVGGQIAAAFDGTTRKTDMGDLKVWQFQYKAPTRASSGMLGESAGDPANYSGNPQPSVNLLD